MHGPMPLEHIVRVALLWRVSKLSFARPLLCTVNSAPMAMPLTSIDVSPHDRGLQTLIAKYKIDKAFVITEGPPDCALHPREGQGDCLGALHVCLELSQCVFASIILYLRDARVNSK